MRPVHAASKTALLLIGSRSNGPGQGIYKSFIDLATGVCTPASLAAELAMPTAFVLSPNRRNLYAVSEVGNDGKSDGVLAAFTLNRSSGELTLQNSVPAGGGGPTTLALDRTTKTLIVGSFGNGRTSAFRVLPDGRLGQQTASIQDTGNGPTPRQSAPHVHSVLFSPDGRFVLAADFGADKLLTFAFDPVQGSLTPHDPAFLQTIAGSGPRQIAFHPNGRFVYVLSELAAAVSAYSWNAESGTLTYVQSSSCFPADYVGDRSSAGLAVHPSGRFLYTTTRTDNSIEVFSINPDGTLVLQRRLDSGGKLPWSCALNEDGRWFSVTNTTSNVLSVYRVGEAGADLTFASAITNIPSPVCTLMVGR